MQNAAILQPQFMPWLQYLESFNQPPTTTTMSAYDEIKGRRGQKVRMVAGTKAGWTAWLDKVKGKRGTRSYIITMDPNDEHENLITTYCDHFSYVEAKDPTNYVEAAMVQYPKLEVEMEKLARLLAQTGIPGDAALLAAVMGKKVAAAKRRMKVKHLAEVPVSWIQPDSTGMNE
jgi:hypothetical protein